MSHFTVTICLDGSDSHLSRALAVAALGFPLRKIIEEHLENILAPWDENREVAPYRDYEDGGPADYWAVKTFREENGLNPDDATLTWAEVAETHNLTWPDSDPLLVTGDGRRAYTMSTSNPDAKWDWWQIGGRWGGHFPYRKGCEHEVIPAEPHRSSDNEPVPGGHCDGGPVRALDLNRLRKDKADGARKEHAAYLTAIAGTPEALPWSVFAENISEGSGYDIGQAREEYNSQPRIAALHDNKDYAFRGNEDFQMPEAQYIERARAAAVPGWATITTDGRWMEQGRMGWFAMSDATDGSKIGYWEAAGAYIGSLPDDAWIVRVDAHI